MSTHQEKWEFFMVGSDGQFYEWGYRSGRVAAIKRLKELREFAASMDKDRTVECQRILTHETRHPHDLDE
jgi:hypothetical protein